MPEPSLEPQRLEHQHPEFKKGEVCNRCSHVLPTGFLAACDIKNPCPKCGYLYPVGDCAD